MYMYVCAIYIDEDIEPLQLNNKMSDNWSVLKKWAKDLKRYFTEEDMCMVKKTHEKILKIISYQGIGN